MRARLFVTSILVVLFACKKPETATPTNSAPPPAPKQDTTAMQEIKEGLSTPESVLYDESQDVYFISNINGQPLDADNNGFIVKVNPDHFAAEKFIEAGKNGVTLNAPKGMAIANGTLYVTDINVVRKFDAKTGAPQGEMPIPGSSFLNDAATDGTAVYVSDSGLKAGAGGNFEPTGTDSIWKVSGDTSSKIAKGKDLNRPNGVEVVDGKIWVVTFGANELYRLDDGKKADVATLPKGSLDGLVHMSDGSWLVSSWESKAIYRGSGNKWTPILENINAPADIGYDTKRHRLLVPHFMDNVVSIHPLQ